MKTYGIFVKKDKKTGTVDDVFLVKEGANMFALIFNVFWFLFHKLWHMAILTCVLASLALFMPLTLGFVFICILMLLIGLEGNNILMHSLDQRGNYYFAGFSMGINRQDAKLKFLDGINKENSSNNFIFKN
ncbi:MAG: DUF2628 domain-containing protein [Rickettsiales bacterium]|jgi:hypothetical protein|nr:DUF2628 domain-containing protein [Rickettsiales bacterium]